MQNIFKQDNKYNLYRDVYSVIHPSISKKNISNYRIILKEELSPLRVFYPKKITNDTKTIIYIPSDARLTNCKNYSKISSKIAINTSSIVIALDYQSIEESTYKKDLNKCYKTVKYLKEELVKIGVEKEKIVLFGDSIGANIVNSIVLDGLKDNLYFDKTILISPISNSYNDIETNETNIIHINNLKKFLENYITTSSKKYLNLEIKEKNTNLSNFLLVSGAADPLLESIEKYSENLNDKKVKTIFQKITFADNIVLTNHDSDVIDELFKNINDFLK